MSITDNEAGLSDAESWRNFRVGNPHDFPAMPLISTGPTMLACEVKPCSACGASHSAFSPEFGCDLCGACWLRAFWKRKARAK
jgi:hypothetical protein